MIMPKTSETSNSCRPVSSNWPSPVPSRGDWVISSAAISDRQANAQPCFSPPT